MSAQDVRLRFNGKNAGIYAADGAQLGNFERVVQMEAARRFPYVADVALFARAPSGRVAWRVWQDGRATDPETRFWVWGPDEQLVGYCAGRPFTGYLAGRAPVRLEEPKGRHWRRYAVVHDECEFVTMLIGFWHGFDVVDVHFEADTTDELRLLVATIGFAFSRSSTEDTTTSSFSGA